VIERIARENGLVPYVGRDVGPAWHVAIFRRAEAADALARLAGAEVHTPRSELRDVLTRTRCVCEDVFTPCDLEVLEAGGHDRGLELCLEQSPGYSVSP